MQNTHNFIIKRRKKIVQKELPLIFGIAGVARCGKDTLGKYLMQKLQKNGFPCLIHLASFSYLTSVIMTIILLLIDDLTFFSIFLIQ